MSENHIFFGFSLHNSGIRSEDCSTVCLSEFKKILRLRAAQFNQSLTEKHNYLERGRDTEVETNEEKPREQKD